MYIAPEEVGKPLDYYRPRGPFTRKPGRLAMRALQEANWRAQDYSDQFLECSHCGRTMNEVESGWFDTDKKTGAREFICQGSG